MKKAEHVRKAKQTRNHTCHWPGCHRQVPPAMWGCSKHWWRLPQELRVRIWRAYKIGQEDNMSLVSKEYLEVTRIVEEWIKQLGEK